MDLSGQRLASFDPLDRSCDDRGTNRHSKTRNANIFQFLLNSRTTSKSEVHWASRLTRWKLLGGSQNGTLNAVSLFDLASDPGETYDLLAVAAGEVASAKHCEVVRSMLAGAARQGALARSGA